MKFADIWKWNGRVNRSTYFIAGFLGFAIKHNLDRLLAYESGLQWRIWNYWDPLHVAAHPGDFTHPERQFLAMLLLSALPFIWFGVTMTEKRLRDAGQPLWLTILFLVPIVNLLFFAVLCALSSRKTPGNSAGPAISASTSTGFWPQSRLGSAALGAVVPAVLGTALAWFDLKFLGSYGLTLFIALPFVMGYIAAWVHCRARPCEFSDILAVVTLTVLLAGAGITAVAIEGIFCLFMAAPIAWLLACFGGLLAYTIHNDATSERPATSTFAALVFVLPALLGAERFVQPPTPQYQVRTSIEIAAPPDVVWQRIIAFPRVNDPLGWAFRLGISYPLEARLKGSGLTADRVCVFSTGEFREPILAWEPEKHFAFGVEAERPLMREWSPYGDIHVRHLDDHDFQPQRADFYLTELPGGRTRLEGWTTYKNRMWPGAYWRLWTDAIVHQIHLRVFRHVKRLAEEDVRLRAGN
jgi:uncharacterized membrane protein YhaH (DUF805 family)